MLDRKPPVTVDRLIEIWEEVDNDPDNPHMDKFLDLFATIGWFGMPYNREMKQEIDDSIASLKQMIVDSVKENGPGSPTFGWSPEDGQYVTKNFILDGKVGEIRIRFLEEITSEEARRIAIEMIRRATDTDDSDDKPEEEEHA